MLVWVISALYFYFKFTNKGKVAEMNSSIEDVELEAQQIDVADKVNQVSKINQTKLNNIKESSNESN